MLQHTRLFRRLAAAALLALPVLPGLPAPTAAADSVTINFFWQGDANYSAQGSLTYDNLYSNIDVDTGNNFDPMPGLLDLSIAFFSPASSPLFQTAVVSSGYNHYDWLELHFDTVTQSFYDHFDIGADSSDGDIYLAGTIGGSASLIEHWAPDSLDGNAAAAALIVSAGPSQDDSAGPAAAAPTPTAFAAASFALLALALRRRVE